jgi:SAM-dependent methyltransferase
MRSLQNYYVIAVFYFLISGECFGALLSEGDIRRIYVDFVRHDASEEYKNRYVPLPFEKNRGPWLWENKDFSRVIALLEFERFVRFRGIVSEKALSINGQNDPEWLYMPTKTIVQIDYEKDPQRYDLHVLDLSEKDFDFVMVNQTLEHLYDPIRCLENIYKHMRKGGILYLNVPANNMSHNAPFHFYTGFTPTGLGAMVKLAGFEIMSIGQWGNIEYVQKMYGTNDWPDYRQLRNPGLNDSNCPVVVWIFAVK